MEFYGIGFDSEYMLFIDEPEESPGIYIIHTDDAILDIGETDNLKNAIETHENTGTWVRQAGKADIYIAFQLDGDKSSRKDKVLYLQAQIKPSA